MLHPLPSIATTLAALGLGLAIGVRASRVFPMALTILFSQFSVSALNDWADRREDAMTGRRRPVALGVLAPVVALALAGLCGGAAMLAGLEFGLPATGLVFVGMAAGWSYDLRLKRSVLSGLPFAVAFPVLVAWLIVVAAQPPGRYGWLLADAAVLATAIHLADALPDIEDDRQSGANTLAVRLGRHRTIAAIIGTVIGGALIAGGSIVWRPGLYWALALLAVVTCITVPPLAARHPGLVRWSVGGFSAVAALFLIEVAAHG